MSHITLVIPTLNQYEKLANCLASLDKSTMKPDATFIIDNGGTLDPILTPGDKLYNQIYKPHENLGVGKSFNLAMKWANATPWDPDPFLFYSNDDCEIGTNLLEKLYEKAIEMPDRIMFIPEHGAGSAWTVLLCRVRPLIEKVGFLDEAYFPAYFEDNDLAYRMMLAGFGRPPYVLVKGTDGYIHHTSSTLKSYSPERMEQHHIDFRRNQQYYISKWGGPPGEEKFRFPFDKPELEIPE